MDINAIFLKFALFGAEWVLWLLILLSLVSIGIMIERGVYFARSYVDLGGAISLLRKSLDEGGSEQARKALGENLKGAEKRILIAGMEREAGGVLAVEEAMSARRGLEKMMLERNLPFLGTLGPTAPFIGLFGTVLGIIGAFNGLSLNTQGGIGVVMADLSEALVATAAGLLVAIPAVIIYNVFQRMAQKRIASSNVLCGLYLTWLREKRDPRGSAPDGSVRP